MNRDSRSPVLPLEPAFTFDLAGSKPTIHEHGNTIREANQDDFPMLRGNQVAFFMINMEAGALRVASERLGAGYCLEGG